MRRFVRGVRRIAGHLWRPGTSRPRRRTVLGASAAATLLLLALVVAPEEGAERAAGCGGLRVGAWQRDSAMTDEFTRYGNDNARLDDWTGGDGTRSVRLPDGRTLWMSADTFLDEVRGGVSRAPNAVWVRNSGLVMSPEGRIERTLLGGTETNPTALFPGTSTEDGREVWRWPTQAVVEPRAPGSSERVVRVVLWQREAGHPPWVFGVPRATEVATLSLPDLEVESVRTVDEPRHPQFDRRVLYGTSAVRVGRWTYVFGADEGSVNGSASRAHVARAPVGRLAERSEWRYWAGAERGWQRTASRSRPVLVGEEWQRGATGTYSVVRSGDSWLLLTMDAGGPDGTGLSDVTTYWSCAPTGPWKGPTTAVRPPLPPGGAEAGALPYNPQGHVEFGSGEPGGGGRLLLGYDVNVLNSPQAIHENVSLYRPRFLRLELERVNAPE
ncbi:hypothetical protein [Streptomyces sp. AJS327]|uniref:hypothetical protein n=1 Tax=Streptomyces sp. AJS327 TaxID=2545265 RepID=UPI0027E57804|nr:hypothetical protein [Streptomyces sp. AJS327]